MIIERGNKVREVPSGDITYAATAKNSLSEISEIRLES